MPNRIPGQSPTLPEDSVNDYTNKVAWRTFKDSPLFDVLTTVWKIKNDEDLQKISVIFNNLKEYYDTYLELEDAYFKHYFAYYKHAKLVWNDYYDKNNDNWIVESNFEEVLFIDCEEIEDKRYADSKFAPRVCREAIKFENAKKQIVAFDNMFNALLSQLGFSYPVYNKELISGPLEMEIKNNEDEIVPLLSNVKFYETQESLNLWELDPTPATELTEQDVMQILNEKQAVSQAFPSNMLPSAKLPPLISSALSLLVWENKKLFSLDSTGYNVGLAMSHGAHYNWSIEKSPVDFNKVDGRSLNNFWLQEDELKTMFLYSQHTQYFSNPGTDGASFGSWTADYRHLFQLGRSFSGGNLESNSFKKLREEIFNDHMSYGPKYYDDVLVPFYLNDIAPVSSGEHWGEFSYGSHLVGHHLDALTMITDVKEGPDAILWHKAYQEEYEQYWNYIFEPGEPAEVEKGVLLPNWEDYDAQKDYIETIPNFQTFLQKYFGNDNLVFFDMNNISDHPKIADFWTSSWYRPFVVKRRNDWYPGMWQTKGFTEYRHRTKKFWEFADLRYEQWNTSGPQNTNILLPGQKPRPKIVLDHVAWYYPKLAAVIAEIIYKVHNIKLQTTCIDVSEKQKNDSQWDVTVNIKHMPDGYENFNWKNPPPGYSPTDEWYQWNFRHNIWNKKGYAFQPKVKHFPPVKFTVNKKALRNDLKERNFVFD